MKELAVILNNKELLKLIYTDLAQPGIKQVGKALGTILGLGNTLLLPVRLLNEKSSITFHKNMERYRLAIQDISDEEIQEVAPEIGVPVLERLTYIRDDVLSEMFIALLALASNKGSADQAHPAFIAIIENLSPDEALLIRTLNPLAINIYGEYAFRNTGGIPRPGYEKLVHNKTSFLLDPMTLERTKLRYPEYSSSYIQNLKRLGLIETGKFMPIEKDLDICTRIMSHHKIDPEDSYLLEKPFFAEIVWDFAEIRYTDFGSFFRHTCMSTLN